MSFVFVFHVRAVVIYLPMGFDSLFCSSVGGLPDFTPIAQVDRPKAKPAHLGGCVFASRQRIRTQKWTRDFARRQGPCFQRKVATLM